LQFWFGWRFGYVRTCNGLLLSRREDRSQTWKQQRPGSYLLSLYPACASLHPCAL